MNNPMITVVTKASKQAEAEIALITPELRSYQDLVGGDIQVVPIGGDLVIVCNEYGRIKGMEENVLGHVGPIFVCRVRAWDLASLTYDMANEIADLLDALGDAA